LKALLIQEIRDANACLLSRDACIKSGDKARAIENYERSLKLAPASKAVEMLRRLK